MTRTEFLREQAITGANKIKRRPLPDVSVADIPLGIEERKAAATVWIFENMPVYIGEQELIVGTRTFFGAKEGNEDGSDRFNYSLKTDIPYLTREEVELFGFDAEKMSAEGVRVTLSGTAAAKDIVAVEKFVSELGFGGCILEVRLG